MNNRGDLYQNAIQIQPDEESLAHRDQGELQNQITESPQHDAIFCFKQNHKE